MRTLALRCALALFALVAMACSKQDAGASAQLMVTLVTDLAPPQDFDAIVVTVEQAGDTTPRPPKRFSLKGPGAIKLPGTVALVAGQERAASVRIEVEALLAGASVAKRIVRTTMPTEGIKSLIVPIEYLCSSRFKQGGVNCEGGQTCIAGACEGADVASTDLPNYAPEQIFGGAAAPGESGRCFDVLACFREAQTEKPDSACTVSIPKDPDPKGLNVAVVSKLGDAGLAAGVCAKDACLVPLEREPKRGWIEDGARLKLPKALCAQETRVSVTTRCPTKAASTPPCGSWSSTGKPGEDGALVTINLGAGSLDGGTSTDAADDAGTDSGLDGALDAGSDAASMQDARVADDAAIGTGNGADSGADAAPLVDAATPVDSAAPEDATVDASVMIDAGTDASSIDAALADAGPTNPCALGNGGCSAFASCSAPAGVAVCTCQAGFSGDGRACTNVNECVANPALCGPPGSGTCTDTPGSYACSCAAGYTLTNNVCVDIDECATGNGGCDANAICTNTPGSRTCACKPGFTGNGVQCAAVVACTAVGGGVSSDTTWSAALSPYCVNASVVVAQGATLTVEPGVVVRVASGQSIRVEGTLKMLGTSQSHVTVACQGPAPPDPVAGNTGFAGCWGNLVFTATSAGGTLDAAGNYLSGSVLRFVDIAEAGYAATSRGVIEALGRAPAILDTTIQDSHLAALYAEDVDNVILARTVIRSTGFAPSTSGSGSGGVELQRSGATITDVRIDGARSQLPGTKDIHDYAGGLSARNGGGNPFTDSGTESARITRKNLAITNLTVIGTKGPHAAVSLAGAYDASLTGLDIRGNLEADALLLSKLDCTGNTACVTVADSVFTGNRGGIEGFGDGTKVLFAIANSLVADNDQFQLFLRALPARVTGNALGNARSAVDPPRGIVSAANEVTSFEGNRFFGSGFALFVPGTNPSQPFSAAGQAALVGAQPAMSHNTFESPRSDDGMVILGNAHRNAHVVENLFRATLATCSNVVGLGRGLPVNPNPSFRANNFFLGSCGTVRAAPGSFTVTAENNFWGATTDPAVRGILVDRSDDGTLGTIDYAPFLTSASPLAPPLPPTNVTKAASGNGVRLEWSASAESDRGGYRVSWGSSDGFRWTNTVIVGAGVMGHTIPNVAVGQRFAVSVFDTTSTGVPFDDRVAGHESWPTEAVAR